MATPPSFRGGSQSSLATTLPAMVNLRVEFKFWGFDGESACRNNVKERCLGPVGFNRQLGVLAKNTNSVVLKPDFVCLVTCISLMCQGHSEKSQSICFIVQNEMRPPQS